MTDQKLIKDNFILKQKAEELKEEESYQKWLKEALQESEKASKRLIIESELISEIGRIIGSTLKIEEVYGSFAKKVMEVIPADRISVNTIDMKNFTREIRYVEGATIPGNRIGDVVPLPGTGAELTVRLKKSLIINKERNGISNKFLGVSLAKHGAESAIFIPLISKDTVIGIFAIQSMKKNAYSQNDLQFAERVGSQIAGAIANAQLFLERAHAEAKLRQSEEKYRSLASISDWLFVVDRDCRYLYANENYLYTFPSITDSLIGKKFSELHDGDHSIIFTNNVKYVFKTGNVCTAEFVCSRTGLSLLQKFSPVKGNDGSMSAVTVISIDMSEHKRMEMELELHKNHLEKMVKERTIELEKKNITLQELNATLKFLLDQREYDKKEMGERFVMNLQNLVLPFVDQIKLGRLDVGQQTLLGVIEKQIHNIATPLVKNMRQFNLTPREIKIATLVKEGKSTKEISETLKICAGSIDIHRKNIRRKLSLTNRKVNLQSYLQTLD